MPNIPRIFLLLIFCLVLSPAGRGQRSVPFELESGAKNSFKVSLYDTDGKEYIQPGMIKSQIDISALPPGKELTLRITLAGNLKDHQFIIKGEHINITNEAVLKSLSVLQGVMRITPQPSTIKFTAQSEGDTQIKFDYFLKNKSEGDDQAVKLGEFASNILSFYDGSRSTASNLPETNKTPTTKPGGNNVAKPKQTAPPASKPEDEVAYENCDDDDLSCLEAFIKKFPKSKYADRARKDIVRLSPLQYEIDEGPDNMLTIMLVNAVSPQIDSASGYSFLNDKSLAKRHWFEVKPETGANLFVLIRDPGKPAKVAYLPPINLESLLKADLDTIGGEELAYRFTFEGVDPPYRIFLKQNSALQHMLNVNDKEFTITYSELQKQLRQKNAEFGQLDVEVYSDKAGNIVRFQGGITIDPPERINPLYFLAALLPILLIWGVVRIFQNRKRKKFEALREKRKAEMEVMSDPPATPPAAEGRYHEETRQESAPASPPPAAPPPPPPSPAAPPPQRESDIKIRSVRQMSSVPLSPDEFLAILKEEQCTPFDMSVHWEDSALSRIHMSRKAVTDLDRFLRQQNIHEIQEQEGAIPEIGGFLMGKYIQLEDGQTYEAAILQFIPVHPEDHDVYMLEFSVESLAMKLGEVQDEFPQYAVVGWFHTHPGHGLFLSKPDMTIQEGFFIKPFQFAMEIDSLSENLDTAFFTRDKKGMALNSEHRKQDAGWFAWTEIEKLTRKRKS